MFLQLDLTRLPVCTRFGRMMQRNHWNRQGETKKCVNLLVFVVSGTAIFYMHKTLYHLCAGDVLLIPAGTVYRADTDEMCEYYFFHFTGDLHAVDKPLDYPVIERDFSFDLPDVSCRVITMNQKTTLNDAYGRLYRCITNCENLHASGRYSGRLALDVELSGLLLQLAEHTERQNRRTNYPIALEQMMEYIRKNLTKPLSPGELCKYSGISASYAARIFRKYLNTTMSQYITDQKLCYACELMHNTGMNITQIASYLGFCDVFYFSRCFKEKFGKSPTKMFAKR